MKITVQTEVPFQRIADVMCGAIEGGSAYWCQDFIRESGPDLPNFYAEAAFYESGNYSIKVTHDDPDGDDQKTTIIGPTEVEAGVQLMATKFSSDFNDMMTEADDAITSDVLLQCIVLKDLVFG
jgi:hypothetical protein